jgi:hypothetical protein
MTDGAPPRVFISYSHDDQAHEERVLDLANRLCAEGIDAHVDQYVQPFPPEGWARWSEAQVRTADFVVMICTETYSRRFYDEASPGVGRGVLWEATAIWELLYDANADSRKFVPVLFSGGKRDHVPVTLRGRYISHMETDEGYDQLYRLLTGQPRVRKPDLGTVRRLREQHAPAAAAPEGPPEVRAPSFSNRDGEAEMVALLRAAGPYKFRINVVTRDAATNALAGQIYDAFVLAAWVPDADAPVPVTFIPGLFGIMISGRTARKNPQMVQTVQSALSRVGIHADIGPSGDFFVVDDATVEIFVSQ